MALELSKQAYEICRGEDAPGLRAFLEEHPDVDVLLHEEVDDVATIPLNILFLAAGHKSRGVCRFCLTLGWI
jgi:hypothetical protein